MISEIIRKITWKSCELNKILICFWWFKLISRNTRIITLCTLMIHRIFGTLNIRMIIFVVYFANTIILKGVVNCTQWCSIKCTYAWWLATVSVPYLFCTISQAFSSPMCFKRPNWISVNFTSKWFRHPAACTFYSVLINISRCRRTTPVKYTTTRVRTKGKSFHIKCQRQQ